MTSSLMVVLLRPLRHRRERAPPGPLHAPGRRHDAHAMDAFHGADHVDATEKRPPPLPGLLQDAEAVQPALLPEWRRIATELAPVQLEAEHAQPVAQSQQPDVARVPRGFLARRAKLPRP